MRLCLSALLLAGACAQAAPLQEPARLEQLDSSPLPLPQLIGTLTLLAERDTVNGIHLALYSVQDKLGECGATDTDARDCPRASILVSTVWGKEGGSEFRLYKTSARLAWLMPDRALPRSVIPAAWHGRLLACEASAAVDSGARPPSEDDHWHFVEYELRIAGFDQVSLRRLPDNGAYRYCNPNPG